MAFCQNFAVPMQDAAKVVPDSNKKKRLSQELDAGL
jgi:hypothetical protein